ncbi:hypothetical protein D3C72_1442060 [compost metagenome]
MASDKSCTRRTWPPVSLSRNSARSASATTVASCALRSCPNMYRLSKAAAIRWQNTSSKSRWICASGHGGVTEMASSRLPSVWMNSTLAGCSNWLRFSANALSMVGVSA